MMWQGRQDNVVTTFIFERKLENVASMPVQIRLRYVDLCKFCRSLIFKESVKVFMSS